jgi:glycosyltransferase involved in cell wall biosynthesis
LHPYWPGYINENADKILVGSEWNVEVFRSSGVEVPIGVIPHGIDMSVFENISPFPIKGVDKDAYVFYDIFQWTERKNPLPLIKAYWYAFNDKPDANVALVLKTYRGDYSEDEKNAIRTSLQKLKGVTPLDYYPPIYLITNMLSEAEIHGLHARGDCLISLNRGEGFGLAPFTAGACGNPVIITNYGGATEYAKGDNSYLLDYVLSPVFGMPWSPWYRGDQLWAEPDVYQAANLMQHVYANQDKAKERGQKLKRYIGDNFTWDNIGKRIIEEIHQL